MTTIFPQWLLTSAQMMDQKSMEYARKRQQRLTKPPGSLGDLELIAEQFAGWQGRVEPSIEQVRVVVFAADHGVCQQGVSAFPQEVTAQMVANFLEGGAAISVLSQALFAELTVVNLGVVGELAESYQQHPQLLDCSIACCTADFSREAAMTHEQVNQALAVGQSVVNETTMDLFIGGEMGIGNTTSASAIYSALLSLSPEQVVGRGTGVDEAGLLRKQRVVQQGLDVHKTLLTEPYEVLRCLGGFEIAALVGSYIACAQKGIPIVVDGFITTAAALVATRINPSVKPWLLFSHQSAESAHGLALQALDVKPMVNLGLRLGEGSGAALIVPILQSALRLHAEMATFDQAGVSKH